MNWLPYLQNLGNAGSSASVGLPDLLGAIAARLRTFNSGALATALGDSNSTPKIWYGESLGSPAPPWLTVGQLEGTREYSSDGNFIESGTVTVDLCATSYSGAMALSWKVSSPNVNTLGAGALDDPSLTFDDGTLMSFRLRQPAYPDLPGVGVGFPKQYRVTLEFDYRFSSQIA